MSNELCVSETVADDVPLHEPPLVPKRSPMPVAYALIYCLLPQVFTGVIGLPAGKFMKETLGWSALTMASFGLIYSIPGYFAPAVAYLRDRWSPFGLGDRVFFLISAPMVAFACLWNGLGSDTFGWFVFGALIFCIAFLLLGTASDGVNVTLSQRYSIGSKLAPLRVIGIILVGAACAVVGGFLADHVGYRHCLFLLAACTSVMFGFGFWRPKQVDLSRRSPLTMGPRTILSDLRLIFRQRYFWMVVVFSMLWIFNPMSDTVMLFFWRDRLHFSMETIGRIEGFTSITSLPPVFAYPFLVKRFDLRRLVAIGVLLATFEYVPLLWAHNLTTAYISCLTIGLLVTFVNTAVANLLWQFSPVGIEASSIAISNFFSGLSASGSAMLGAWILQKYGLYNGFNADVIIAAISCLLIAPFVFLIPRRSI